MGVGSGITWDSVGSAEWEECAWKAAFLRHQPQEFEIFETLRWEDDYKFPDEHIARMFASAEYFSFPLKEPDLRRLLEDTAARFEPGGSRSERLSLPLLRSLTPLHSESHPPPLVPPRL